MPKTTAFNFLPCKCAYLDIVCDCAIITETAINLHFNYSKCQTLWCKSTTDPSYFSLYSNIKIYAVGVNVLKSPECRQVWHHSSFYALAKHSRKFRHFCSFQLLLSVKGELKADTMFEFVWTSGYTYILWTNLSEVKVLWPSNMLNACGSSCFQHVMCSYLLKSLL